MNKVVIQRYRQIVNCVSVAETKLWRRKQREDKPDRLGVSQLWRTLKVRKINLNLNCCEIGSQRMDSRNANDIIEEAVKVNEISTESLWVIKKKVAKGMDGEERGSCGTMLFLINR